MMKDQACQDLLRNVWSMNWTYAPKHTGVPPDPYLIHWRNCINEAGEDADDPDLLLTDHAVAIKLVSILKDRIDDPPATIQDFIRSHYPANSTTTTAVIQVTNEQAEAALRFSVTLWLHISPQLNSTTESLRDAIKSCLPQPNPTTSTRLLSSDFCAKHLSRKGRFNLVRTEQLDRHLHSYRGTIEVFCNASMLLALQQNPKCDPFPPGFVTETLQTLNLLFRPFNKNKRRWTRRYKEKNRADLEFGNARREVFDLASYPYWHDRLVNIQRLYNETKPLHIEQWWYDRRDRVQFATFWVAFVVLTLTIVFGLTQSVTAIVQVYAIYHPPSSYQTNV